MKKYYTLFLLMLYFSVNSQSIKVVTYNIMGMKPGTDPQGRLSGIIKNLKLINPDIIGIQEINEPLSGATADNQCKIIADSLSAFFGTTYNFYYQQTHLSWNNQFREYIGIITKFPVEQSGYLQMVQGAFPRKVVWNYISSPLGKINFFNTHFDYQSTSVRMQQASQAVNYISQQESQYPAIVSVITGDFNDTPNSDPIKYIFNAGFTDSYALINPLIPGYTVPSNAPTSKIDFVFFRNGITLKVDTSFIIMDQPYYGSSFCSDHLGVMTVFSKNTTGLNESIPAKKIFHLEQNYPNPFNPSTTIKYKIAKAGIVSIKIYDILGVFSGTLLEKEHSPGNYSLNWNASDLSAGAYFCRMSSGGETQTTKMVLIK